MNNMQYRIINVSSMTEEDYFRTLAMMTSQRRGRALCQHRPEDTRRTVAAELLARTMAAQRFGIAPDDAVVESLPSGQPVLSGLPCHISLSHSGDYAMCALADRPVGADIELADRRGQRLLDKVCTPEEQAYILASGQYDPVRFFQVWTAKEACLKRTGAGLSGGMQRTVVADAAGLFTSIDGCALLSGSHENVVFAIIY